MIRFACPSCEKVYSVPDSAGGRPAACKQCRARFVIPDPPSVLDLDRPPAPPPPVTVYPTAPAPNRRPAVLDAELVAEVPFPPKPLQVYDATVIERTPQSSSMQAIAAPQPPPPPPPPPVVVPKELEPCPKCTAVNSVAAEHVGMLVLCPFCNTVYHGELRKPPPPPTVEQDPNNAWTLPPIAPMEPTGPGPATVDFGPRPLVKPYIPPPPPPPPDVDIAPCPRCRSELTVPPDAVGGPVECPFCGTVYTAVPPTPTAGTRLAKVIRRNDRPKR
jgi:uncharacterized Zn-finger protein